MALPALLNSQGFAGLPVPRPCGEQCLCNNSIQRRVIKSREMTVFHIHRHVAAGLGYCYLTSVVVLWGLWLGSDVLPRRGHPHQEENGLADAFFGWDATWYSEIAARGYAYNPNEQSSVAFFPAYPLLGRGIVIISGVEPRISLMACTVISLTAVFVLMQFYCTRIHQATLEGSALVITIFGLFPTTLFFRMAYTESLFVLLLLLSMYGMARHWPHFLVAVIIGLATATRPVGVALLPVFAYFLWQESGSWGRFLLRAVLLLPLACWGLLAYMGYLWHEFGDPLAFVRTQQHWAVRPLPSPGRRIVELLVLEPIWSVYVPSSSAFWGRFEPVSNPLLSLQFANPIYFVATGALVVLGARKKWLDTREVILSAFLLLIPYVTHSQATAMMAQGRYAASVFPAYIVMGHLLARCPAALAACLCAISACLLAMYSALFAAWYRII